MSNLFVKAATTDVTIIWGTRHNWMNDDHDGIYGRNILAASIMFHEIWG